MNLIKAFNANLPKLRDLQWYWELLWSDWEDWHTSHPSTYWDRSDDANDPYAFKGSLALAWKKMQELCDALDQMEADAPNRQRASWFLDMLALCENLLKMKEVHLEFAADALDKTMKMYPSSPPGLIH